ncbi:MAG: hypothetical protein JXA90_15560 [Planctomycetes bacterium]|nr:hypothetical protein [Planctomycetota bacterium]
MVCLEGTGALSHLSIRNKPDVFNEPCVFAAVCVKGGSADGASNIARVLEGPLPTWKIFGTPESGNGGRGKTYGLPRFARAEFIARFPFATVTLSDDDLPVRVEITGWSPFQPGDADASSLPVAALEYRLANTSSEPVEAVFSFNARNFLASGPDGHGVRGIPRGFVLFEEGSAETPWEQTAFCAQVSNAAAKVNCAWFRGGWFDPLTIAWKDIAEGACFDREPVTEGGASPGGTIFVPLAIAPGETATVPLRISWYCGASDVRRGKDIPGDAGSAVPGNHEPWYSGRFGSVDEINHFWKTSYDELREKSARFRDCFYDTTLPPEVIEAVAANLTILKSPTVMRQQDGRLWCWEGCCDAWGCCHGSCTHVWNYAQAIPHLFPELERTLRETEFEVSQDERGHQAFRSALPIRPTAHDFHAAADGQLGGILKVHRDWRISGDTDWMRRLWPRVKASLEYCIAVWDPKHKGILEEPHHNTYDIEFWGPDGMCSSFYLGALRAADLMGTALGDDTSLYRELLSKGARYLETELYDGEYFIQKIQVDGLEAKSPLEFESFGGKYSPEAVDLLRKEGPKYQYGTGCLSDGVIGAWMAAVCGAGSILDEEKVTSHLLAVHRYNLKRDLSDHVNPQRPTFACGSDGGLLLCTWPNGGKLSLPFVYSDEVWTGIEYQVASHLLLRGRIDEGLEIVRVCRDRYDGRIRNPFNEYECGHWYARALASYALLEGLSGARYDAVEKKLHLEPRIAGDFRAFLSTATGYGTVGVKDGAPFVDVKAGAIDVKAIEYTPAK